MANNQNLKPFKKGQSGNPNGRKKDSPAVKQFKQFAKSLCKDPKFQAKIRAMAMKGNDKAMTHILHYGEGKPKDQVNVGGKVILCWDGDE